MNSEESALSEATGWGGDNSLWNGRRRRLQAAIACVDELYADLYRRAIDALSEQKLTPGAVVVAGHCIRNLVNGLPDALADVEAVPAYSDLAEPARQLASVWTEHQDVLGSAAVEDPASNEEESSSDGRATVPKVVIVAARKVVVASIAARGNSRRRHSALVLGRVEAGQDPTVKLFSESVRAFEKVRHPSAAAKSKLMRTL